MNQKKLDKWHSLDFASPVMLKNKDIIVGSAFLALGLLGNNVYSSADSSSGASDVQQGLSKEETLWGVIDIMESIGDVPEIVKLVRSGVDLAYKNKKGRTFLYQVSCPEALAALLSFPAIDMDSQDCGGDTAMHHFSVCHWQCLDDLSGPRNAFHPEIEMLIESGANPCLKNKKGETPRQILEEWKRERRNNLSADERSDNAKNTFSWVEETIQMLRDAEIAWAAAHPEWMAAHPECAVE